MDYTPRGWLRLVSWAGLFSGLDSYTRTLQSSTSPCPPLPPYRHVPTGPPAAAPPGPRPAAAGGLCALPHQPPGPPHGQHPGLPTAGVHHLDTAVSDACTFNVVFIQTLNFVLGFDSPCSSLPSMQRVVGETVALTVQREMEASLERHASKLSPEARLQEDRKKKEVRELWRL